MTTVAEMNAQLVRLSQRLDAAHEELVRLVNDEAKTEHEYRKARANSYLSTSGTVGEREAHTDKTVADERYRAHLAAGLAKSQLEAVRSIRAQMSALQTMASATREEMKMAGVGS